MKVLGRSSAAKMQLGMLSAHHQRNIAVLVRYSQALAQASNGIEPGMAVHFMARQLVFRC